MHPETLSQSSSGWQSLGTPAAELRLEFTLTTGQSFRWRQVGVGEYVGVIGQRVVHIKQLEDDVVYQVVGRGAQALAAEDATVMDDYFNTSTSLAKLAEGWCAVDQRYRCVYPHLTGGQSGRGELGPRACLAAAMAAVHLSG